MVSVKDDFRKYTAPAWVAPTVIRLIQSVPPTRLIGLSSIVLTESAATAKVQIRRRAGRKHRPKDRLGFYHKAWRGGAPIIHLIVDNILDHGGNAWLQMKRDVLIADVLFHEIGHHLNVNVGLIARNEEASAEAWSLRLWQRHVRKRYSFLIPLVRTIKRIDAFTRRRERNPSVHRSGGCSL